MILIKNNVMIVYMKYGIIYKVTNTVNQKCYIGQTTKPLALRWPLHTYKTSYCRYLSYAIKKYGKANFTIEELVTCSDREALDYMEIFFIKYFNSMVPNGYNLRDGGSHGKMSEESKKLCSVAQRKNWEAPGRKQLYAKNMKEQWAENPELAKKRYAPIAAYIKEKKRPILSVCMSTGEVNRYATFYAPCMSPGNIHTAIEKQSYYKNCFWFYNTGQTDQELVAYVKSRLNGRLQPENIFEVCGENIGSGNLVFYNDIYDTKRDGFDVSSVRKCLEGKITYTKGTKFTIYS